MLGELLKHNKLGNGKEILFVLFDALPPQKSIPVDHLKKYCLSNMFSISQSFDGILNLLVFLSFLKVNDESIQLDETQFLPDQFEKESYFQEVHFFEALFKNLNEQNITEEIFNLEGIKFCQTSFQYFVQENDFPFKFFPIRNLLLATNFFERSESAPSHIYINDRFTKMFKEQVITPFKLINNQKRKHSLAQLKATLKAQEEAGKAAENYVLQYERSRLQGHPDLSDIRIISEENSSAGFDIESFNSKESIILDRYIEVKSYRDSLSFYWSKNEIEVAKALGDKYHLYLVDRARMDNPSYKPQQFQNPYKKVFLSELWTKNAEKWQITLSS